MERLGGTELPKQGSVFSRPPRYAAQVEGPPGPRASPAAFAPSSLPTALPIFRHCGLWKGFCTRVQQQGRRNHKAHGPRPTVTTASTKHRVQWATCILARPLRGKNPP